ncbi:MAG: dihydroneopterin aldolase [Chloroflexi bacterium]|nr:dihydroneopterin aldolase [Chloroflexota bacterium]
MRSSTDFLTKASIANDIDFDLIAIPLVKDADCLFLLRPLDIRNMEADREVCLDLALYIDISAAAASDKIEDAIDYSVVIKRVSKFVTGSKFKLIEALAEGIAAECLSLPGVTRVGLRVEKVGASEIASAVAVEITRPRSS